MRRAARRIEQVQAPVIPIVGQLIRENPGTISLGQGIVHYPPPSSVLSSLRSENNLHLYGDVSGEASLIDAIRIKLRNENQLDLDHSEILFTAGSNMAFLTAVLAIADVDDEIVIVTPYYFNHRMAIEIAGCQCVLVPATSDYQLDLNRIRDAITDRTRAIVTISPNNPTGAVYRESDLVAVNQLCEQRGMYHVSDEAYEYFIDASESHFSPGSLPLSSQHTISIYTLSKAYGMAGWRCGYMAAPDHLALALKKIQDTNLVCAPIASQRAALAALRVGGPWCRAQTASFQAIREQVLQELRSVSGCQVPKPQGAFYMLLQLDSTLEDMDLVTELIRRFGVATLPGSTFGVDQGCAIRISYGALEAQTVMEGVQRLTRGLKALL